MPCFLEDSYTALFLYLFLLNGSKKLSSLDHKDFRLCYGQFYIFFVKAEQ